MTVLSDHAARTSALTSIDQSLLVEAGAGSGKTSVMAGRVNVLFASGVQPKHIAAITFTEFAASELRSRIERFAAALCKGEIPRDLASAFPNGISPEQRANVQRAYGLIDQLACTTIHGFAQALVKPYPAEARIDPGAEIIDPGEADLAFQERYEAWLKDHLSGERDDGIVAELFMADERGGLKLISEIAQFLRNNRDAQPPSTTWSKAAAKPFLERAQQFQKDLKARGYREEQTAASCKTFVELAETLERAGIAATRPNNRSLVEALNLPKDGTCFRQDGKRRKLQTKGKWEAAAKAAGQSKADGTQSYDALNARYENCHDAFEALLAAVAGELLTRLTAEMRGLIESWHAYKRAAALLDFDDLLYTARGLLAQHDNVREALTKRFRFVMVDEFQDTDPLQIEILWRICGESSKGADSDPLKRTLRPGALFLVGDPKQAIYRFRGADVNAYIGARKAIGQSGLLNITSNFRSLEPILDFVNRGFEPVLSEAAGQPGFSKLAPVHKAAKGTTAVAALDIEIKGDKPGAAAIRDAEASRVADLCRRLVGNLKVRDHHTNELRPCRYGDIALLAPVGTDLWRFEEALEDRGIPVSTQAGKGFFHRQEIQDLIALTRALADTRDTLALGALLRGPLVGLSEAELMDIADALPIDPLRPDRLPTLSLATDPDHVPHDLARSTLEILRSLRKRANTTTPHALLSDAIGALHVQPHLKQRIKTGAERAIANVDLFLEVSRAYDVRGLRAFARDMRANWEEATRQVEGRPDSEAESVALITVHASKGLEWSVVVPINMTGTPRSESGLMQDRRSNAFSIPMLGVEPTGYEVIKSWNEQEHARERVRLWYVAATRARDLLVLPRHSADLPDRAWARVVDLGLDGLDGLVPEDLGDESANVTEVRENTQTRTQFSAEASIISGNQKSITWLRPSRAEESKTPNIEPEPIHEDPEVATEATEIPVPAVAGSSTRGTILHKLMEEVLLGETVDETSGLENRARELLVQLGIEPMTDPKTGLSPKELAATITRTLAMPEVSELRPRLVPEHTVFGREIGSDGEVLLSGIADAVAVTNDGAIDVVIDWKSDVDPAPSAIAHYKNQIAEYQRRVGAKRAMIVMMTGGQIVGMR